MSYRSADEIPDEELLEAFEQAIKVVFSARFHNTVAYRSIGLLGWWIPLSRLLPIIGVSPKDLCTVFGKQPEKVTSYDDLGSFPCQEDRFAALATVLNKTVLVRIEDGATGEHRDLLTASPSRVTKNE